MARVVLAVVSGAEIAIAAIEVAVAAARGWDRLAGVSHTEPNGAGIVVDALAVTVAAVDLERLRAHVVLAAVSGAGVPVVAVGCCLTAARDRRGLAFSAPVAVIKGAWVAVIALGAVKTTTWLQRMPTDAAVTEVNRARVAVTAVGVGRTALGYR
jgi:hypothetical protein